MVKEGGIDILEQANRLGPLKDPVALLIFSTGLEKYFHEHCPEDFPRISTRGHFDRCRTPAASLSADGRIGGRFGLPRSLFIDEEHDATDYDSFGTIPGFDDDGSPDEIVVFVHGWLANEKAALGRMSLLRYTLESNGYAHPVVGFTWDTNQTAAEWEAGKVVAGWNGPKLAQFTADYADENPDTKIRYVSNSLGAHPLFSALESLDRSGFEDVVESATVLGGTVPSDSVANGGRYADGIRNVAGDVYNYWTPSDKTLGFYYKTIERVNSVGGAGSDGETPDNFHDRCVSYVPDHFSFLIPSRGCMDDVVQDFGIEPPGELEDTEVTRRIEAFADS